MMLEKAGGYKMGLLGDRELKSMDTGACYLVKKMCIDGFQRSK